MNWKDWTKLFWHGDVRMMPVYVTLYWFIGSFGFLVISIIYQTNSWLGTLLLVISVLAIYAVFTDEVAHLFPFLNSPITGKQWIYKMLHGRTHDVYGIIIAYITFILSAYYTDMFGLVLAPPAIFWVLLIGLEYFICDAIIILEFYAARFYH